MAETKLTITKEQAEAFANWKREYRADIRLAKIILKQELRDGCGKSKLYAMLDCMLTEIQTMDVKEGSAVVYGKGIVSDIQFGMELEKYLNRILKTLSDNLKEVDTDVLEILFVKHINKVSGIFDFQS